MRGDCSHCLIMELSPRKKKPEKLSVEEDMTVAEVLMILNYNLKASLTVEDPVSGLQ